MAGDGAPLPPREWHCFRRLGGVGMLHYRAYLLDKHSHVISAANLYCADEQAARERAEQLADVNDVELWQLDRRIAIFKSGTALPKTIGVRTDV